MAASELSLADLEASDNKFAVTELMVFFRKLRISPKDARVYAQRLVDLGYDDVQALCEDVSEEELKGIGMRPGHIKRVRRALTTTDWTTYSVNNDEQSDYDSAVSPGPSRVNSSADLLGMSQQQQYLLQQQALAISRRPPATILPSDPSDWTYYDTIQWLSQFEELRQERIFATVEHLRVDGQTLLRLQTASEIDKLDIPVGPARERFMKELFKLQHQRDACSSSDAQDVSSRKTRSNLGTITEDEEASDGESRPDAILTHVPSFYYRQDETDFYSSAVGDLSGISDTEEVRRNLAAAILEPREVPRRRTSLSGKSQDSDHSKRNSRAHRQTMSDDDAYAEPKRAVSAVQHRPKSQHEAQSTGRPTHRREKSTSAPPSAHAEPLSGGSGVGANSAGGASGGEPDLATTRRARRPSKKLKSAKSARRLSLTAPTNLGGGGMSTDNGSDDEEEDVKTLLVANNSDADGLSGVEADVDAELSLLSSHYQPSKMAKAFKPNLRVDISHSDSVRSSPVTPKDLTKGPGSQGMSPGDLSEQEEQRQSFNRLLRAAGSNQKLKRPKSLMQFAPGGQLHLQLGSSTRSQTTHFTEQGTFQAGGFQLGPNGISGVPESLRNTMSPSSSPIATPKYTREATILLEELGRGACGTVQKGIYVPALTMVAVKFVQVHDDDRRRQMVRELKAFYSMSVSSFEDDDEPEYAPNASSASLLSQTSESSTLQGRLSDSAARQPLDEVSQNPEVITTQDPAKRKRVKRRSPFIVNFYDAYTDPERGAVAIVLEYMNAGSLQDLIHNNVRPDEEMIATIAYSVLHGLHAIHTRQIIHRDVKPGNILLTRDGHVKLSDFGVMRELVDTINARTFTGTMYYMSPERIRGEKYSFQSDIWSLGVSLITLATGSIPFPTDSGYWGLIGAIQDGPPPSLPEDMPFSQDLRDFVNECVQLDQAVRPTADILLNHPFLLKTLKLEPNSFHQYPPAHVPKLKLPPSFAPAPPRNFEQIIDSILEWQMEHLLDEEYFPSTEPSRRHSISNAGEREHKDMLMQKLTLIQYSPRQISRLANQMWLNTDVLQQAFATRWEVAEEQLRSSDFLFTFAQPPFSAAHLRQRAWMEERAQFSDSASSAYGTPRAAHHHRSSAGDALGARRRSLLSRRASHTQALSGYSSASGRGSDLDTNEMPRGAPQTTMIASAPAERKTGHSHASTGVSPNVGGGLEIATHSHVSKDSPSPSTPAKSPGPSAQTSPADKKIQQLKAFFQAQPQGIISPIATDEHSSSFTRKSMGRRRTSSRSLTDLDDMETEAATPRMIEKPNSPLMMPHLRRPSTGHMARTSSDNMATILDVLLAAAALPPAEAKGPELSLLQSAAFPAEQELHGRPKSGDGLFHSTERKGMHQRSRSRGYASHVRNLSSSTNSSTHEKHRPNRNKPRSRRRSLPDEVFSSGAMPSVGGTLAMARVKVADPVVPRRNTICTVSAQDSSVASVYGPVSDDDTCTENFQWSLPTSAATRPQSAVSPFDDTVDAELSKDALLALELDATDIIDP